MEEENRETDELNLCDDEVTKAAAEHFGIKYVFPWQRLVIANIIDAYKNIKSHTSSNENEIPNILEDDTDSFYGGRQIVLLPTGAGKSLCFQLPAFFLDGATLVVYPLLALMSDQERRMQSGHLECVVFRGGMSVAQKRKNFERIKSGAKIIIANPEILLSEEILDGLSKANISHIAIDEAHCVSEWGNSFRPSYLELGKIAKRLNVPIVTAFTATASPEVLEQISSILFNGTAHIVRSDSDRANIHYYVKKTHCKKASALFLAKSERRPMIIFCGTKSRAEEMSRDINCAYGEEASRFYHAGLERDEKTEIEKWFFDKEDAVLCATCAYGMGVDKKNIRTVIHLDAPETAEAYIQEAGRGGRDGGIANALLLWDGEDERKFSALKKTSRKFVMVRFANTTTCRREVLLEALGGEKAVCDGCDLCDTKKRDRIVDGVPLSLPGEKLPVLSDYILTLLRMKDKYYTLQTLEEKALCEINTYSRTFTEVNIWWHEEFEECIRELLYENKIKIRGVPWKNHIALSKEEIKYHNHKK